MMTFFVRDVNAKVSLKCFYHILNRNVRDVVLNIVGYDPERINTALS